MTNREDKTAIIYKKLVRDRIPEIIRNHGKTPFFHGIDGSELKDAIGEKILEEAFELFNEWKKENKDDILKESADLLEIILTALKPYGFGLNDLLGKMREREEKRGGFSNSYFLDQVGGEKHCEFDYQNYPTMVFNPAQKKKFINILKGELKRSTQTWIASAFYSPGTTNLLLSELSQFIENKGTLKIILSTMGNITRPEYFTHIEKHIPGMSLKVFHPPGIPFDQAPPNFHVKAWLFLHRDGKGSLITGSSNFTESGLTKNFEWNYFSSHEINLPFGNSTSPFESAVAEFERIWANESVDVSEELNRALENDTRTAIIAHNLGKYLPSAGKVKALTFCSSVSHARYTAERLSNEYGFPAVALWGDSPDEIRHEAISRLQQETDPLNVICTVDIFNEGVDIPELTHVLFLRPTQSFTVFLQQLGRGLRKAENKDFLVVLDFVGNFRKAHVAPLALCGYTSLVHFLSGSPISFRTTFYERLPDGCYLSPDLYVQRIWEHEIKRLIDVGMTPAERLKLIYRDIKKDLNLEKPLNLMDMISNAYGVDPYTFFKPGPFENWLRAKKYCEEGYLDANEEALLGTPGEYLLQHIESGLKPVRSYKMVVLKALLKLGGSEWEVNEIASEFLSYYLTHKDHLSDYEALARSEDPEVYPLSSVISHIKRMPLDKLSNAENDCFILDGNNNLFKLKPEFVPFWEDPFFRALVMDRVEFTLIRYFERVVDIPYTKKTESGYTAEFRELFKKNPDSLKWEKIFENSGYSGSMEVEILEGDNFRAWTGKKFEDKSRFPARIKAAATGLKCERLMGKYKIIAQGNSHVVRRQ